MDNREGTNQNYIPKILKSKPVILTDGTSSYNVAIKYPEILVKKIKELAYKNDTNFTEVILYCIDQHQLSFSKTDEKFPLPKKVKTPLKSVRFRESQVAYVEEICEKKELTKFTQGVLNILFEYFNLPKNYAEVRE